MKKLKQILLILAVPLSCFAAKPVEYVCRSADIGTSLFYHGEVFKLKVNDDCLMLTSLEAKDTAWSWKIYSSNSLGDKEGLRNLCNKADDGLIGQPAIWRQGKMKFISFDEDRAPSRFNCQLYK
jgi:hypothetical protein